MQNASLDRINPSIGYTKDNIRWVHKRANFIKGNLEDGELLQWCIDIVNHLGATTSPTLRSEKMYNCKNEFRDNNETSADAKYAKALTKQWEYNKKIRSEQRSVAAESATMEETSLRQYTDVPQLTM